ncbi:hypothetical protein Pelo_11432 [Pelomyxa schiedti]|nr:hypothetical protein Pelo_11432 [Pelomyxa schiedti]
MTTYILGLLQKQLPKYELMDLCTAQLSGILDDSVNFVAILFDKLEQFGAFHDTPVGQHGFLHNVNMYTNTQGHAVQETLDSSVLEIHHTANVADRCAPIRAAATADLPRTTEIVTLMLLNSGIQNLEVTEATVVAEALETNSIAQVETEAETEVEVEAEAEV